MFQREFRRTISSSFIFIAVLATGLPAQAQLATLLNDPDGFDLPSDDFGSRPRDFVLLGDRALFTAEHPLVGSALWTSDGSPEGTGMITALEPIGSLSYLGQLADGLLFVGVSQDGAYQLLHTDGTRAGTTVLVESDGDRFFGARGAVLNGNLLFFGGDGNTSADLWASDGTATGTRIVNALPELALSFSSITILRNRAYFAMFVAPSWELWVSDGTAEGTGRVQVLDLDFQGRFVQMTSNSSHLLFATRMTPLASVDLWSSNGSPNSVKHLASEAVDGVTVLGDRAFFTAFDSAHGNELWSTDGTLAGTRRISDLPGTSRESPSLVSNAIGRIGDRVAFLAVFSGNAELWTTRSRSIEMERVAVLEDRDECIFGTYRRIRQNSSRIFFESCLTGTKTLWSTDGTAANTIPLRTQLDPDGVYYRGFLQIPGVENEVLFLDDTAAGNVEIFSTDGILNGTRRRTNMPDDEFRTAFPGPLSAAQLPNGTLLFAAVDVEERGEELWAVDATPSSTRLVADIDPDASSSRPGDVALSEAGILFLANDSAYQRSLWQADESGLSAELGFRLIDLPCDAHSLLESSNQAFLLCRNPDGAVIRATDGTLGGTQQLFQLSFTATSDLEFVELAGASYIVSTRPEGEIWRTDGTAAGSTIFRTSAQLEQSTLSFPKVIDELLYFTADNTAGSRIVRTDGTDEGTVVLASGLTITSGFWKAGSAVFFRARGFSGGDWLWETDGTPERTRQAVDLRALDNLRLLNDENLVIGHEGSLYFIAARGAAAGVSLWKTAGTLQSTIELANGIGETIPSTGSLSSLASIDGYIVFRVYNEDGQVELWRSDGNPAGTGPLRSFADCREMGSLDRQITASGRLFFAALDPRFGCELWVTDGTSDGTRLVHDIAPGPFSSSPEQLAVAGNRLYFTADDGLHGRELWSLNLDETGCVPSERALCLQDGRFRVEADWKDFQGNEGRGTAVALTPDTGYFWFFNPSNVEAVLKVLDGRDLNDHFWIFYGALSTVEYNLTITDAETGVSRRYYNPPGNLASRADTASFGPNGASLERYTPPAEEEGALAEIFRRDSLDVLSPRGSCAPASNRLCLRNGRFAVEASWRDFQGNTGSGTAVPVTGDTGTFWFFRPENLEVILKVLDGTGLNEKHWVFYGALSSVEYTLTVTDTSTGAVKTYFNPLGRLASVADTGAF